MRVRRHRAAAAPRPPPARCLAASRALFPGPPARLEPGFRERVPRQAKSRLPADRGGAHGFWRCRSHRHASWDHECADTNGRTR